MTAYTWTPVPCGTRLTVNSGTMRLHATGKWSLWVLGNPSRKQWLRAVRLTGMDKRQGRRFIRRHAAHQLESA